jgi:hypothetical protein
MSARSRGPAPAASIVCIEDEEKMKKAIETALRK